MRTTGVTKEVRMPIKSLPPNPSLAHLKYQARDLLNALTQGNPEAVARTREFHPKFARLSDEDIRGAKLSLADAQLIVAREYGFDSWPKLKHHVEGVARTGTLMAGSPAGFKPPAGAVELKQKWPSGARIVKETNLKQSMAIYTPGMPDPVKQELSLTSQHAFTVVKELPAGGREVELQHLSFRLEFDSGACLWRYNSAQSSPGPSEIDRLVKILMGGKVRYFLDADNQVERIEGAHELVNRINLYEGAKLKGMTWNNEALDRVLSRIRSGARQPLDESTAFGLKSMFNEEYFKRKMDSSLLPRQAVQPGDTWTCSREAREDKSGILRAKIMQEYRFTFQSWDMRAGRLCARLEYHGTEKTIPQEKSETISRIVPVKEGTFSGVIWFDPDWGRGIEVNMTRDSKITSNKLAMPAPSARPAVQPATDHYHVVLIEKLVSVGGTGGSS